MATALQHFNKDVEPGETYHDVVRSKEATGERIIMARYDRAVWGRYSIPGDGRHRARNYNKIIDC